MEMDKVYKVKCYKWGNVGDDYYHRIVFAMNHNEALRKCSESEPDLVLCCDVKELEFTK